MNRPTGALALGTGLVLFGLLLCGCGQLLGARPEIRQKHRYTVAAEPVRQDLGASLRPYPVTVQLQLFDIAGHYNQLEIITRSSPYEFRRDQLHTWGVRPREMLTYVVAEYLRDSQLFSRLLAGRDLPDERPDYILSGEIKAVERFDSGDRWFARLQLSMQLVRRADGTVLWQGEIPANDEIEVFDADMQYTVQAMSEILRRRMESFIRELDGLFMRLAVSPNDAQIAGALADSAAGAGPVAVRPDTAAARVPDYYEIIPGKLAP
jgi:ABC-type uncharacterized transport system auxiliary subunit